MFIDLLTYQCEFLFPGVTAVDNTDVHWAAILSWGHPDSILRITNRKGQPPVNFMHWSSNDEVSKHITLIEYRQVS